MTVHNLHPTATKSVKGVVFGDNAVTVEAIREDLGLRGTLHRLRGRTVEPRLLIVGGCSNPYAYRDTLTAALGADPALYWLTGGAL